jgi:hypothetical protein
MTFYDTYGAKPEMADSYTTGRTIIPDYVKKTKVSENELYDHYNVMFVCVTLAHRTNLIRLRLLPQTTVAGFPETQVFDNTLQSF